MSNFKRLEHIDLARGDGKLMKASVSLPTIEKFDRALINLHKRAIGKNIAFRRNCGIYGGSFVGCATTNMNSKSSPNVSVMRAESGE